MKKQKNNIFNLLLKNKRVNYYTKLLIYLQRLDYFEDYYIPNKKIMNILNIDKKNTIRLLKELQNDHIIAIFYKNRKRYFTFTGFNWLNEIEENNKIEESNYENDKPEIFSYDWLNDNE